MINYDEIRNIGKQTLEFAKSIAITSLKNKNSKLIRDINECDKPEEVERIMWMAALSAEGLSSIGSKWKLK